MNDQLAGQLRQYLQIIGTSLTTLGFVSADKASAWVTILMAGFGLISMIASLCWAWWANTKESIAASFSQMPEIKKVETNNPELAKVMKEADPTTQIKVT